MTHRTYVGTSGWYYDDWREVLLPEGRRRDPLRFLANYLDAAEVNASYYRPVDPETAASWVRRLGHKPDFLFTAKLWKRFTHERDEPPTATEREQFVEGLRPLADAGRLAALLAQFPWSFRYRRENVDWLAEVVRPFQTLAPVVVEVRHDSWLQPEALRTLQELGLGFCNIDQPQLHHCIPPTDFAWGPVGYVRLHGRNAEKWFEHESAHERYDYLYSLDELREWVPRVRKVSQQTQLTFVFCNNHYRAQAVVNALQLKHLLSGQKVPVPERLREAYPELSSIAAEEGRGGQRRLF